MAKVSSLCVFCGSRVGNDPAYGEAARALGEEMARRNIRLVYGAGSIGLMGEVAKQVSHNGGKIIGIIPEFLDDMEVGLKSCDEFIVTSSMHERKARMFDEADAFVSLPGGLGTLDETFEILTWAQLELHDKPIIILDINGYWQALKTLIDKTVEDGFASNSVERLFQVVDSVEGVFDALEKAPPSKQKTQSRRL